MDGAGRPLHFLARELLKRGARVLFVEAVESRPQASIENFSLVSLNALGFDERALRRAWFGLDPQINFTAAFSRALDAFETPDTERVVVYGDPFVPFLALFSLLRQRGYKIVYDALDDFSAFPEIGLYFANLRAEEFLIAHSELVVAVSTTLVEKLSQQTSRTPIQLLRQGFDPDTFRPQDLTASPVVKNIADPSGLETTTLGFWGQVNAFNIDVPFIEYIAQQRPQWTIQLIGPVDHDPALRRVADRLRALPNVQLIGRVPHAALPAYLKTFDVALVPFPDNAFNRARDPLKVFEYLSGYKPIVAAHTPQLAGMPYVLLADTPPEFLATIERALTLRINRAEIGAYLDRSTWSARLDELLAALAQTTPSNDTCEPDINAWYADAALAPQIAAYLERTEQLLEERTRFVETLEADARAKQSHIERLQQTNPFWRLKGIFSK